MSEKEEILEESVQQINRANAMIADDLDKITSLEELVRKEEENILALENETASLSDELKGVIENLAVELDQKMGEEYSYQKRKSSEDSFNERLDALCRRIREKISFYASLPDGSDVREKLEADFNSILESLETLKSYFDSYKAAVPPFIDSLLAPEGLLTKKRSIEENEEKCRSGIEKSRQRIAQARQDISSLTGEVESLRETVKSMEIKASSIRAGLESFKTIVQNLKRTIEENTVNLEDSEDKLRFFSQRIETIGDSLKATDEEKKDLASQIADLKEDLLVVKDEITALNSTLVSREADGYWRNVDLYIGGTEHATGHLIYSRFWNKFLYDLGYVCEKEPFKRLINQGMIQGRSNFVYRIVNTNRFVSYGLKDGYETTEIHVDVNIVHNDRLDIEAFRKWMPDFADAEFILENGEYICGYATEKMSKSMFNVVNPDMVCDTYGADTLRLYEMFLGPLEQSKPWDTKGIDGVHRFLKRLWRLYYGKEGLVVTDQEPLPSELKVLHKLIGKIHTDIEAFSFNTAVSAFMIAVNELYDLKCSKRGILEPLVILLSPFAPHISEELWEALGHKESISFASFPEYDGKYVVEASCTYAVSFNGKTRFTVDLPKDMPKDEVEAQVRSLEQTAKYVGDGNILKIIVVPGKIVNLVVK